MQRFLIGLCLTARAFAALPATTVWEVRPTVGSDTTASGCFDSSKSGTDYSQQNAAQYTATDLATSGTTSIVISVSHSFVATDVGNCLHITTTGTGALFTVGFYEIVSVSAGLATLDRACASSVAAAGGTYYVGGALATIATANTNAVASNIVWVKATGTYTVTAAMSITLQSTAAPGNPYSFIGYTSTRGDAGQATWTTATNSIDLVDFTTASNVLFQNFIFTTTAGTRAAGMQAIASGNTADLYIINDSFSGFTDAFLGNFNVNWGFQGLFIINSRITASTSHGILNSCNTYVYGSMVDNNAGAGGLWESGNCGGSYWVIDHSIFYKNGATGFQNVSGSSTGAIIVNNSDFSTNTGAGLNVGNVVIPTLLINCSIFDANTTYGLSGTLGTITLQASFYNNAFYNNTTAPTLSIAPGIGTITLSASPYVTLGSNFNLNSTSGGGAALKNTCFPGTIPGAGAGSMSVGALQPAASTGGTGAHGYPIVQ